MATDVAIHPPARALLALAHALAAMARSLRGAAKRLDTALERRRECRLALQQLREMGERELRDIGLSAADIRAVARGRLRRDAYGHLADAGDRVARLTIEGRWP